MAALLAVSCSVRDGTCDTRVALVAVIIVCGALALGAWWLFR